MGKGFSRFADDLKDIGNALWWSAIACCFVIVILVLIKAYRWTTNDDTNKITMPYGQYPQYGYQPQGFVPSQQSFGSQPQIK